MFLVWNPFFFGFDLCFIWSNAYYETQDPDHFLIIFFVPNDLHKLDINFCFCLSMNVFLMPEKLKDYLWTASHD